ncbi:ROK domain transcriptional regulator/sugar kinase [Syntrophotalea carbinolica DSM 2380]|uniref:ROK domain transcriptional regulator/sugar kinase n=1 Tax=Syntrophotalea carbinolica (strain DSM 2380 / NBRC 103641 / GraBd1) TaxID=338963 RepID=Q3A4F4_SYNC1|nr:ROK family protein [Syntrophotalea carbinolica]ABA88753.1 ROK domain transcriptional regulator/sugar kinase [Syntrophotalea carbinolica DSM 2380]
MNPSVVIGIDLGGTNCRGALVTGSGELLCLQNFATDIDSGFDCFWRRFLGFCRSMMADAQAQGFLIEGLGLGFPGLVAADGSITVAPNLPPFNGLALRERLCHELGMSVRVANDVNAIALGEAHWGAGRDCSDFLMVTLGTGVGGGLIVRRQLWSGCDGAAGEVGHIVVEPDGYLCGCGSRGCLEQYASGPAVVRNYQAMVRRGTSKIHVPAVQPKTAEEVAVAALNGDAAAMGAFEVAGRYLGQVLAGVANLLNLEAAVIGGGVGASFDLFLPSLRAELEHRAFAVAARRMQIKPALLGDKAGILGAASLVREMLRAK